MAKISNFWNYIHLGRTSDLTQHYYTINSVYLFYLFFQIHDVAEFLGGDLKTKNQHIRLEYKTTYKLVTSSPSVTIPSNESSLSSKLAIQASILSTSPVMRLEAVEQSGSNSPVLQPKRSMAQVESQPCIAQHLSLQTNRRHLSASDPDLRNIKHGVERGYFIRSTGNVKENPGSLNCRRPLPPPPPGHESQVTQSNSSHRYRVGSVDRGRRKGPTTPRQQKRSSDKEDLDLDSSSSSTELEALSYQHSSNSFQRQKSADFSGHYRAPSPRAPSPYEGSRFRSDSNESDSLGDLDNSDTDSNGSTAKKAELRELHLYILTENSPMFMHLRSTWNDCILVSVLGRCITFAKLCYI